MRTAIAAPPPPEPDDTGGHPTWCAKRHHCTAHTLPTGEHASRPEIWETDVGRFIATRYRRNDGRNHVELRVVLHLDGRETIAEAQCRHLVVTTRIVINRVFSIDHKGQNK